MPATGILDPLKTAYGAIEAVGWLAAGSDAQAPELNVRDVSGLPHDMGVAA